jgi:hypothetical protein
VNLLRGLAAGAAGAAAVTALHQTARPALRHPPRMDVLGKRALKRAGVRLHGRELEQAALAGDLLANTAYFALAAAGLPRNAPWRGLALGVAAGVGALFVPQRVGLGSRPSRAEASTAALTVAWYAAGGLVAGLVARSLLGQRHGHASITRAARWEPFPSTA